MSDTTDNNTFEFNDATIAVRRETVRDRLSIDLVIHELEQTLGKSPTLEHFHWRREFARFLKLSEIDGDIGFPLDGPLTEVFEKFMDADAQLYDDWVKAANSSKKTT